MKSVQCKNMLTIYIISWKSLNGCQSNLLLIKKKVKVDKYGMSLFQIVNEGSSNPGIRYSYSVPKIVSPYPDSVKDPAPPSNSNSAIDKPSKPHRNHTKRNHSTKKETVSISKPSNIRIKLSRKPSIRPVAQTRVRVLSRPKNRYSDVSISEDGKSTDLNNTQQFVYTHGVQVYGGDNSITRNVYDGKKDEVRENADVTIGRNYGTGEAQEIRYPESVRTSRIELISQGDRTREILLSAERYMWADGHWTPCSSKCGDGT